MISINLLTRLRFAVSYCPTLPEDSDIVTFLRALGIDWPTALANWTNEEREEKIQEALENSPYRQRETERGRRTSGGGGSKAEEGENEGALRINLKRVFQEEGLLGYDPSIGTCTGEEHKGGCLIGMLILGIQCLFMQNCYVKCAEALRDLFLRFVREKISRIIDS